MAHRVKLIIFSLHQAVSEMLTAVCQIDYSTSIVFHYCILLSSMDLCLYFKQLLATVLLV